MTEPRIYSNLKFLHYGDRIEALRRREVVAPVHVRIKPVNRCNHSCWYCAYRADQLQLGEDMDEKDSIPPAKMFEIVDDLVAMGVKAVTFSGGGEPTLYKQLPEAIERLARGGVGVASLTNGSNLQGRVADAFAAHGTWLRVSLEGWDDASYARFRGIKEGAFSKLIRNMRDFVARRSTCVLGVSFIVGQDNHRHIYDVCALMKDVGVNHVKISGAVVGNDARSINLYHRDIMTEATAAIEKAMSLADGRFAVVNHYHETEERFAKSYTLCPFLQFLTVIGADCAVYTCQDKAYTQAGLLGSIRDISFREFWFSEENRRRLYGLDPSRECQHHCISHAKNLALDEVLSLDSEHARFV